MNWPSARCSRATPDTHHHETRAGNTRWRPRSPARRASRPTRRDPSARRRACAARPSGALPHSQFRPRHPARNRAADSAGQLQPAIELHLDVCQLLVDAAERLRELLTLRDERADVLAAPLRHAHRLRVRVAFGAQAVTLDLRLLAALIQRLERRDVQHESAPREIARDGVGVGCEAVLRRSRILASWRRLRRAGVPALHQS